MTNIPAEITDIKWNGLNLRMNGVNVDLRFSTGGWGASARHWLNIDGFYLAYERDRDVMGLLSAVNEDNREVLVLSKLLSMMWSQYSAPALSRLLYGEIDAVGALRSVYLSLTHKEPRESRRWYLKIKELLPEAWNLFKDEENRKYLEKLMDFETHLIARGIKG